MGVDSDVVSSREAAGDEVTLLALLGGLVADAVDLKFFLEALGNTYYHV